MMTKQDQIGAMKALIAWLRSQNISLVDAAFIMTAVAGTIVWELAGQDEAKREDGLALLERTLHENAKEWK